MNYSPTPLIRTVLACLLGLVCVITGHVYAAGFKVTLVLSEQAGAYREFRNAVESSLSVNEINLSVIDADKPLPEADLVIAAGLKASEAVARAKPAAMLAVLVPKDGIARLMREFPALAKKESGVFSAIYLDQPLKRQLGLISAVLPQAHSVGVLYSEPPRDMNILRSLAAARRLELKEESTTSFPSLHAALQSLLLNSDVLLALPDTDIYNPMTIRNILLATYRNKVPLIGFSAAYVKAGALCAVFSTPEQIAEQSLKIIYGFVETRSLPPPQYAKEFDVTVNEQVARSLGINIKSASQVRNEIGAAP